MPTISSFPISRESLRRSGKSEIPDRLGFSRHLKTRLSFSIFLHSAFEAHLRIMILESILHTEMRSRVEMI